MVVVVVCTTTECAAAALVLGLLLALPIYAAIRDLPPSEVKITVQLPVPLESVIEQFVSAPVIFTVPVGKVKPTTLTETVTGWFNSEGSGVSLVIRVTVTLLISTS
jgi:hypothetical protein